MTAGVVGFRMGCTYGPECGNIRSSKQTRTGGATNANRPSDGHLDRSKEPLMAYSGTSSLILTIPLTEKQIRRFWSRVQRGTDDECWEWNGFRSASGYGRISLNRKTFYAHRVADFLTRGSLPEGLYICHHCDNPSCCNPSHLYRGTQSQNCQDRENRHRRNRYIGRPGRRWSVSDAVERYEAGDTLATIAASASVSVSVVRTALIERGVAMRPTGRRKAVS